MWSFYKVPVEQLVGLVFFAGVDQVADFLQMGKRLFGVVVVGLTAPESFLVQLDFLGLDTAIDHGSENGIAYGKGFQPCLCRLAIP